ncbi:alpha/beta hydrolase [Hylemonella gracilis str. Niagara R]|uniref:Alpha/beta hydrolase n=1 Tax=Hylemonella gracilis str. Niagara R TaxID=1458275 RepID=A0A016XLP2_9BURK|nr:alpha/beta hydrolase [Hylemonella gracilis]EYC52103.1 alpha/beta hydrolase [Hylemonella gracilis str. Niagara R]
MKQDLPPIIFSHGNGFPAGTYRQLLDDLRRRGFRVSAVEKYGHDPQYPVTSNWPHLVQQLADFASDEQEKNGEPAFLVGHSLGGFLSLMAAARHPDLALGVLLIDSPILGGWRAASVGVVKRTQLISAISPGVISRKRRDNWPDADAAYEHFRHKKAFMHWQPEVLRDYVEHGMHTVDGKRVLSFQREVETAIYNTLPHHLDGLLKRHPLKCPVAFIGGRHSVEMKQVGMAMTEKVTKGRITMLDGSHLFPMEQPVATGAAVEASLRNLMRVRELKQAKASAST